MLNSIKLKILVPLFIITGLSMALIIFNGFYQMKSSIKSEENYRYQTQENFIRQSLESVFARAEMGLLSVASNPVVQEAFAQNDRALLLDLTAPVFNEVEALGIEQFQFHTAPAVSYLRLHMPQKYGDDLSQIRPTIAECNTAGKLVKGLEEGRGGYGFRVVSPVFYQDKQVGSVEFGVGFNQEILEQWKERLGGEFMVYRSTSDSVAWNEEAGSDILASTIDQDNHPVKENLLQKALSSGNMEVDMESDERFAVSIIPLKDYSGKVIGYIKSINSREQILTAINKTQNSTLMLLFVSLAVFAVFIYVQVSYILRPVGLLSGQMAKVGAGDLTNDLQVKSRDELGRLAQSFNAMLLDMRSIISKVGTAAKGVSKTGESLSSSMEQASASVQGIAATSEQLSASVQELSAGAQDMTARAGEVFKTVNSGKKSVNDTVSQMDAAKNTVKGLSEEVTQLTVKSQEINKILEVIGGVAEQTNLLALNAAIEAARAGEQGRGFAVVAQDIRRLAEQSKQATSEISTLIEQVLSMTGKVASDMSSSLEQVDKSAELVNGTGDKFAEINDQVGEIVDLIYSMADSTQELESSGQQTAAASQEQAAFIQQVTSMAASLADLAGELEQNVNKFKV